MRVDDLEALAVGPGETLILTAHGGLTAEEADDLVQQIKERCPELTFVLLDGRVTASVEHTP